MYHLAIFPYDRLKESIITWKADMIYGEIIDVISPIGWDNGDTYIKTKERLIKVKTQINDVSEECDSLWFIESSRKIDFEKNIIPLLNICREKKWKIFWGRNCSKKEEDIINSIIPKEQIIFLGRDVFQKSGKDRVYDFRIPLIFVINMFPELENSSILLMLYDAICQLGYKPKLVTHKKDLAMYENVSVFSDCLTRNMSEHEKIISLNWYFKLLEREDNPDLFLIDVPGNLLEVSKKICGDFGCNPYLFLRALQPDYVLCNMPYMDTILDNYKILGEISNRIVGVDIDSYHMVPQYLDIGESENNELFDYTSISNDFLESKIKNEDLFHVFNEQHAIILASSIIEKLEEYSNVKMV